MKKSIIYVWLISILMGCSASISQTDKDDLWIKVKDGKLYQGEDPYYFVGTNYWYGMYLGMEGEAGDRERLIRELDDLAGRGLKNLRILASSEGPEDAPFQVQPALQTAPGVYNEEVFKGLDFLLSEMSKRDMKAVMVMNNFWTWSGGMPQYLLWSGEDSIPYPPPAEGGDWYKFVMFSRQFYQNNTAQSYYNDYLKTIINRKNHLTGAEYRNDPTIMSWQLANEPRGYDVQEDYQKWIEKTASFIKEMDGNHLVCVGSEGNSPSDQAGINTLKDNSSSAIDYITMHIWVQNWSWYNPDDPDNTLKEALTKVDHYFEDHMQVAKELNKPIVLEEFGIARDGNSYEANATTQYRDQYFEYLFEKVYQASNNNAPIMGANFWSYAGEGRAKVAKGIWQKGDDLIGDPPHEPQGWYSVYDHDTTTLNIAAKYASKMEALKKKNLAK